jgi:hypothetical protein
MSSLSSQTVIDAMASQLADRRARSAAYLALARAIVSDESLETPMTPWSYDHHHRSFGSSGAAFAA